MMRYQQKLSVLAVYVYATYDLYTLANTDTTILLTLSVKLQVSGEIKVKLLHTRHLKLKSLDVFLLNARGLVVPFGARKYHQHSPSLNRVSKSEHDWYN